MNTPWGRSERQKTLATGIVFYSTPGHGGYWLSQSRLLEMPEAVRMARGPFDDNRTHAPWFEEDCEWSLVCLAFPEYFSANECGSAIGSARTWSDQTADHYPGWRPWNLDVDHYLATTFKGRQCAAKAGIKLERLDGVSPPSPHWFAGDIPSDALEGVEGPWQGTPSGSEGSGEQQATMRVVYSQADLFAT